MNIKIENLFKNTNFDDCTLPLDITIDNFLNVIKYCVQSRCESKHDTIQYDM